MSTANTVPDTQLGLSNEEIQLLRQGQAALGQSSGGGGGSSSSRAASRASSQGLLLLDSSSLTALGRYFDRVMAQIEQQMVYLSEQSSTFTMAQFDRAGNLIEGADAEIERYHQILQQLDELELDFDRIRHIKEIVKGYRSRVEEMERELERSGGGGSSSRHRDGITKAPDEAVIERYHLYDCQAGQQRKKENENERRWENGPLIGYTAFSETSVVD